MTREEAVKEIEKAFEPAFANYIITALAEGATVSDKEPTTKNDLGVDAISRQAVIDELKRYFHDEYYQRTSIQDCRDCFIEDVLNHLPSVAPQETTLTLDKIREEIGKTWHTKPKNRYEEGLKDQALKDMQIIDKYKAESEG